MIKVFCPTRAKYKKNRDKRCQSGGVTHVVFMFTIILLRLLSVITLWLSGKTFIFVWHYVHIIHSARVRVPVIAILFLFYNAYKHSFCQKIMVLIFYEYHKVV